MQNSQTEFHKKLLGRKGERQALKFLKKKKYKILKKNYVTKFAEADIIALYGDLLVFVEVKTRTNEEHGKPGEAVDFSKQKKYCMLAQFFCLENKEFRDFNIRFDVIEVLDGEINHIENAFYADDVIPS